MRMTRQRPSAALKPLRAHNVLMTREEEDALYALHQQCADMLGRHVSAAGIIRALVRASDQEAIPLAVLVSALEQEMRRGRHWGLVAKDKQGTRSAGKEVRQP